MPITQVGPAMTFTTDLTALCGCGSDCPDCCAPIVCSDCTYPTVMHVSFSSVGGCGELDGMTFALTYDAMSSTWRSGLMRCITQAVPETVPPYEFEITFICGITRLSLMGVGQAASSIVCSPTHVVFSIDLATVTNECTGCNGVYTVTMTA